MLSEEEKKDLLEMAGSAKLREEFRRLNVKEYPQKDGELDLDWYLEFLTMFSRIFDCQGYREERLKSSKGLRKHRKFIL
ncbi:MAG: hypothetical protein AB7E08_05965 [Candidatus Omnitrophota bacterium]